MKYLILLIGMAAVVLAQPEDKTAAGKRAFLEVVKVLQSPRCMNCHPAGDRPLQGDDHHAHAQNISRKSIEAGLQCSTCHQDKNSEAVGVAAGPPGAPHWGLPPANQIFQNRSAQQICEQMRDPKTNNGKDFAALLEHAKSDPIVLWGWAPGGKRTLPPLTHDQFAAAFETWINAGAPCP
ncbi:MAG: multiheme c-type cytochrome [Kofleriaceae bacterium]